MIQADSLLSESAFLFEQNHLASISTYSVKNNAQFDDVLHTFVTN